MVSVNFLNRDHQVVTPLRQLRDRAWPRAELVAHPSDAYELQFYRAPVAEMMGTTDQADDADAVLLSQRGRLVTCPRVPRVGLIRGLSRTAIVDR